MNSSHLRKPFFLAVSLFVLSSAPRLLAAEAPLELSKTFDLSRAHRSSRTFFDLMSGKNGIKSALDSDYNSPVIIADVDTFRSKASNFDHLEKLEQKVKGGSKGLDSVIAELAGESISMDRMYGKVMGVFREKNLFKISDARQQSRLVGALVPIIGLTSGRGVLVKLDSENYVYNFGYAVGSGGDDLESDKQDRKTGRSYGASISRNAYDPSDNDYLRELAEYTNTADQDELQTFYETIFEILLKTNSSKLQHLSQEGQTVVADFMAIYMAELDRHLMTGLRMYEWENALTEITMLAAFCASDEGVTLDSRVGADNANERGLVATSELEVRERLTGFFGVGTDGSGLDGANKRRRHEITRRLSSALRTSQRELVRQIEKLIGARANSDLYDQTMNYVNSYESQESVREQADELIGSLVELVLSTRANAPSLSILNP
jgi:hypothetical protein